MNKFLITLATLVAFTLSGFAYAQTVSGQMQRIIGVGDDVDGGVSEQFTRFVISTEKTADNGWVIGGSMSIQTAAATGGRYAPSTNNVYIQTKLNIPLGMGFLKKKFQISIQCLRWFIHLI